MQYTVAFNNLSENDQLVLRLIFSLSARARGRSHSYSVADDAQDHPADICIRTPTDNVSVSEEHATNVIWFDMQSGAAAYTITRPLIASRVLSVLDRFIKERATCAETIPAEIAVETAQPAQADIPEHDPEVEFCISEEEASQLAIVEDETLTNPANLQSEPAAELSGQPQDKAAMPGKVSSLVVLHKNKEVEISKQAFEAKPAQPSAGKPRALVVDDSPSVRKQIELELDLFNVDVDYAASLNEAMSQLDANQYDVAFLDVVLPDGDGFQICRNIKTSANPATVIMLTGKATPADKIKGTMAGCDAYLVKPVGRMTFQNTVCNHLQLREQLEVIHA